MLNHGYAYATIIGKKDEGQSLLCHLASQYSHATAEEWQKKLHCGEVTLDDRLADGSERLKSGQRLVWNRPPWVEPEAPRHFDVLFEDASLLAVNKPSGLPTLPGAGFQDNTLLHLVRERFPGANPAHRLGRGTSGIVLFAKSHAAASRLAARWNTAEIQKIYRAFAQHRAARELYEILTPIGRVPHPRLGFVWAADPEGKPAKSTARVLARGENTTTFAVALSSGRPHQIRIHLASIGHPLMGDPLYGANGLPLDNLPGLPGDGGYLLHAQFLRLKHPITGEPIDLEAPLPTGWPNS